MDMVIYGLLITLISMYYPEGVWKLLARIGRKMK
jgi:ABC-type branched-subunit amino acid transport system permease subunit